MRSFILRVLCAFASLCALSTNPLWAQRVSRPNIVFFMADGLECSDIGCYGSQADLTPNLDAVAGQGLRFNQFYCGGVDTAASYCGLLTGLHSGHAIIRGLRTAESDELQNAKYKWEYPGQEPIPHTTLTFTRLLRDAGYKIGGMGKWGLGQVGTSGDPALHGFNLFYGYYCLEHAQQPTPAFLWRNDRKEVPLGNPQAITSRNAPQRIVDEALAFMRVHQDEPFLLYLPLARPLLPIDAVGSALADEADLVSQIDSSLGAILSGIDHLGLSDRTILIVTSNHSAGPLTSLGKHSSRREMGGSAGRAHSSSGDWHDNRLRVPLVIRWPNKVVAGQSTEWLGAHWDFFPTLCELAGLNVPAQIDGLSFAPLLRGEQQESHGFLYWEAPGESGWQAVRSGQWKAVRQANAQAQADSTQSDAAQVAGVQVQLFDLSADPSETTNVARQHPEIVQELESILSREHAPSSIFPLPGID